MNEEQAIQAVQRAGGVLRATMALRDSPSEPWLNLTLSQHHQPHLDDAFEAIKRLDIIFPSWQDWRT